MPAGTLTVSQNVCKLWTTTRKRQNDEYVRKCVRGSRGEPITRRFVEPSVLNPSVMVSIACGLKYTQKLVRKYSNEAKTYRK